MLSRDDVRRLEIWDLMAPFAAPDFEELAYGTALAARAARRAEYADLKAFDPAGHRAALERSAAAQRERRGADDATHRPRSTLRERDVAGIRSMHAGGATLAAIGRAYRVSVSAVSRIVRGTSHREASGPVRPALPRGAAAPRGARHPRAKLTPELVERVLATKGSLRAVGLAHGLDKRTVQQIRAGHTWVQRGT